MSYKAGYTRATGKGIRSNHRAQYNWFRCSGIEEALEHWDTEVESGRHACFVETFEPTVRRRPQPEGLGSEATQSEDRL